MKDLATSAAQNSAVPRRIAPALVLRLRQLDSASGLPQRRQLLDSSCPKALTKTVRLPTSSCARRAVEENDARRSLKDSHQLATTPTRNECGNCDVFCPKRRPLHRQARFFASVKNMEEAPPARRLRGRCAARRTASSAPRSQKLQLQLDKGRTQFASTTARSRSSSRTDFSRRQRPSIRRREEGHVVRLDRAARSTRCSSALREEPRHR